MSGAGRRGGDADYAAIGTGYLDYRRPDPRIAARIVAALGDAHTVLNVGAGTGSYEPADRMVTAVEPSEAMRRQRAPHLPPAIDAVAEELPFADAQFDASMAIFTVHQWRDLRAGLAEMRRVTRGPVLVMTCDPQRIGDWWLADYAPEVSAVEAGRYPPINAIAAALGASTEVVPVPIPRDCSDGFNEAYYARPERLLDPAARRACSSWSFVPDGVVRRFEGRLRSDLADGSWVARHGHWREQAWFDGPLRLIVGRPASG